MVSLSGQKASCVVFPDSDFSVWDCKGQMPVNLKGFCERFNGAVCLLVSILKGKKEISYFVNQSGISVALPSQRHGLEIQT